MKRFLIFNLCVLMLAGCQTAPKQKDTTEEMRSAVEAVKDAVTGSSVQVKYCPVDGAHFSADLEMCPQHGVKLVPLDE